MLVPGWEPFVDDEEDLPYARHRRPGGLTEHTLVVGHIPVSEDAQPLLSGDLCDQGFLAGGRGRRPDGRRKSGGGFGVCRGGQILAVVLSEESDPGCVGTWFWEVDPVGMQHLGEIVVGRRQGDSRAVARAFVRTDSPAMLEFAQSTQGLLDDFVGGRAAVADDECETTCIVFESGIIESGTNWLERSFRGRRMVTVHRCLHGV